MLNALLPGWGMDDSVLVSMNQVSPGHLYLPVLPEQLHLACSKQAAVLVKNFSLAI